jgi:molecular chaperone DnaJ
MRTYYDILGLPEDAPVGDIRRAFRTLVRQLHPDVAGTGGASSFREVREAYETLSNAARRRHYDRQLGDARQVPDRVRQTADWMTDEVDIDFPSMAAVTDRILRTFRDPAARVRPVRAEILVSPREASEGISVPLEVPMRATCHRCGGRGESWTGWCGHCEGTGEWSLRQRVHFAIPPGVSDGSRFRFRLDRADAAPTLVEVEVAIRSWA